MMQWCGIELLALGPDAVVAAVPSDDADAS